MLEGAAQHLQDAIIGAVVEVEFVELYKGQPLFSDVEAFMRDLGFTLFDLDIRRWRRRDLPTGSIPGRQSGQIVWADGLWLKDPLDKANADATWACDRATKLVVLAELFGLPDYAIELTEHFGERSVFSRDRVAAFVRCLTANQPVSRRLR